MMAEDGQSQNVPLQYSANSLPYEIDVRKRFTFYLCHIFVFNVF